MNRRLESLATLAYLTLVGASLRSNALAQGLPAPGPGGPTLPAPGGGNLMAPVIILAVALLAGLILAVAVVDLRRKRRAQAIAIEGQIADALMREPRLTGTVVTTVAHVPLTGRSEPTVEVRGEVEYPELRETAVRIVRQELLRHHPEGRVEDRIFVSPPIPTARR
jgi:hypothetical protein